MQNEIAVEQPIDISCLIKTGPEFFGTRETVEVTGYVIDMVNLVLEETRVLRTTRSQFNTTLRTLDGEMLVGTFRESKAEAFALLRQAAEKTAHHAAVTLQALDTYDKLVEKGLVDAG